MLVLRCPRQSTSSSRKGTTAENLPESSVRFEQSAVPTRFPSRCRRRSAPRSGTGGTSPAWYVRNALARAAGWQSQTTRRSMTWAALAARAVPSGAHHRLDASEAPISSRSLPAVRRSRPQRRRGRDVGRALSIPSLAFFWDAHDAPSGGVWRKTPAGPAEQRERWIRAPAIRGASPDASRYSAEGRSIALGGSRRTASHLSPLEGRRKQQSALTADDDWAKRTAESCA